MVIASAAATAAGQLTGMALLGLVLYGVIKNLTRRDRTTREKIVGKRKT